MQYINQLVGHSNSVYHGIFITNENHIFFNLFNTKILKHGCLEEIRDISEKYPRNNNIYRPNAFSQTSCVLVSPDKKYIIAGSFDYAIRKWDMSTQCLLLTYIEHSNPVTCACYSPDGSLIASGSWDKTVHVWSEIDGKNIHVLRHTDFVNAVSFSPSGREIVSCSYGEICVWNIIAGVLNFSIDAHQNEVLSVSYSPDGNHILSGSYDRTICIWNAHKKQKYCLKIEENDVVTSTSYSPDGTLIVSGHRNGIMRVYSEKGNLLFSEKNLTQIQYVSFSPDGNNIIIGQMNNIHIYPTLFVLRYKSRKSYILFLKRLKIKSTWLRVFHCEDLKREICTFL